MIEARALISLLLLAAIFTIILALNVRAADIEITVCSSERVKDHARWAWREIDRQRCWYRGEPGRSKHLLRWTKIPGPLKSSGEGSRPEIVENPLQSSPDLGVGIIQPKAIRTEEIKPWQATGEDQLKALTCCWPEPEQDTSPMPVQGSLPTPIIVPRATPPTTTIWPITLVIVIVSTVAIILIGRTLT
jgi:hypothetical protein